MPAYRNRMWDGKIRLFDMRAHTLYCGLYKYLEQFCTERNYQLKPSFEMPLKDINIDLMTKELPLTANKADITPRSYQKSALKHALDVQKSLLLSPTASGKSLIIYLATRFYINNDSSKKILIVNHI